MSTDNYDQTKTSKQQSKNGNPSGCVISDGTFDGRKIKKEKTELPHENGDNRPGSVLRDSKSLAQQQQLLQRPATGKFSNGYHDNDLVHDIIAAKFSSLNNHSLQSSAKHDKIQLMLEDSISEESKSRVQEIFSQVEQLKLAEKLLLYLKLPLSLTNPGTTIDPLRQPLNPLGNRSEIHQTIMWIKTHLEEDPDVSLPKQEVYDEYNVYCTKNSMKPLSTADFGKVMKQVYPRVRPRRLGTRGNSRYCYAGMRKRIKLDPPSLPTIPSTQDDENSEENFSEDMLGAASSLIREWAEKLLGTKFTTLSALARHLVDHLCVDTKSLAAACILYASGESSTSTTKENTANVAETSITNKPVKMREAQLQLQRKLQQREHTKDQKNNHDAIPQPLNQNKEKTVDNKVGTSKCNKKARSNRSPQGTNISIGQNSVTKISLSAAITGRQKKIFKSNNQTFNNISPESNCDTLVVQSIDNVLNSNSSVATTNCENVQKDVKPKNSRKRANSTVPTEASEVSPEKQTKISDSQTRENVEHSTPTLPKLPSIPRAGKVSVILAGNLKPTKCKTTEAAINQPAKNCDIKSPTTVENCVTTNGGSHNFDSVPSTVNNPTNILTKDQIQLLQESSSLLNKNDKLCTIDPDALDDYLNGGNNSQEQEEELLQYFQQSSSSSSDIDGNLITGDIEPSSRSDKVSQLRLILQQNLKADTESSSADVTPTIVVKQNVPIDKREIVQKNNLVMPTLVSHPNQANTKRRVSFETNVVEHVQDPNTVANTVPQSPNTRRRIFNFTPISPGPHSPINVRTVKSSSANASPFVSPRNTPVPRSRSNLQGNMRTKVAHKTFSRSISCSVPYSSKTDTFIVPTSGPDLTRPGTQQLPIICTKSSEVQVGNSSSQTPISLGQEDNLTQCTSFLASDLAPQKQLLINYPSQENLQEIKNSYQRNQPAADREISELFHSNKQFTNVQLFYRSQSVPLHKMVNPVLMSPISSQHSISNFQNQSVNPSTGSSIAPTPVPSEFNDFGSIGQPDGTYLLEDVDSNFIAEEQEFLIDDKDITSENITNILNILGEDGTESLQILPNQTSEQNLIENNSISLNSVPDSGMNIPEEEILNPSLILDTAVENETFQKIIHSRSYPNTPLPVPRSTYALLYTDDSNGSRSYPSTPLHTIQPGDTYRESNEPMLSNLQTDTTSVNTSNNLCRNVSDLLESTFLGDTDGEADELDTLGNFDGLQDVDSLAPLFNEVTEPNR